MNPAGRGNRRLRRTAGVVTIALVATVAGSALAAPAGAKAKPTITIGVIAPVDGGLTSFGQGIRDSVKLAVKQANDANRVKGWTVEVEVLDDSSTPAKGKAAAQTLAGDRHVVAVVGPYNSGVALEAAPVLAAKGIALLSPSNTLTSLTVGDNLASPKRQWKTYFRLVGPDSGQAGFLAAQAKTTGFKTAAVVSETKAVSKGLADSFVTAFKSGGGTVAVQQTVPDNATATDFAAFVTAAAAANPDVIFFGGEYNVAAILRTAATAAGIKAPLMGGDGMNDPAYISGAGAAAAGTLASGVGIPLSTLPGGATWQYAYKQAGFTTAPSDYGPYAYDAANLVLASLAKELKGKSKIPGGLRATVVRDLQRTHAKGLTGSIAFDAFGDVKNPVFTLYRVAGAAFTPIASSS